MKEKYKRVCANIIIALILIIPLMGYYGFFSSPKPSVIVHLAPNITEIIGFEYARYPGTMQCIACEYFSANVNVYFNNTLLCNSTEGTINIGEVYLPIRCDNILKKYEGQMVKVEAVGSVTPSGSRPIRS